MQKERWDRPETQHKSIHDTLGKELTLFGFCAILLMIELCLFVFKEANSSRFTLQKFAELSEAGSCLDVSQTHVTQE